MKVNRIHGFSLNRIVSKQWERKNMRIGRAGLAYINQEFEHG
jgi:hypothetical protein